ncbi:polyprenyl synthetase family protein [Paenibacillus sp. HN-1]|uniref:polyprenyl synthetase family protein n=1 Tax=Paenibacillus TaxID=44249 RepID=UPI001CA94257|nr:MULTISPECIES: polyprenyl synthetase family protein [Paenibacillus]MBY9077980.1 polyprenyl synthetase family protein [Paenibacillus sp. CGMCC 1.18879]MBY9083916.1 polyprenyl synthetase family protein [Paenibacillus sinensis]
MDNFMGNVMSEFQAQIDRYFRVKLLHEAAQAAIETKFSESLLFGKMTLLHYRMFGGEDYGIYKAAAAVEMMILALDIIDDLQDEDHADMPWCQLPKDIALNLAIGFLSLSQETLLYSDFPAERTRSIAALFNDQLLAAINGQTLDLMNEIETEEDYLVMVRQKSAALLVCACTTGVILATGSADIQVAEYAEEIGIAAQIKNDYRDLLNWDGKNDFIRRKRTLPLLFLLAEIGENDQWIAEYFAGGLEPDAVLHRYAEFGDAVERTGTQLYTSVRMRSHYYRFLDVIEHMEVDPKWRDLIIEAAK